MVKNLAAKAGVVRDLGSIPRSGGSPGGGHGSPLQCSCLENPMDRGAWWATVYRVTESDKTEVTLHAHMGREELSLQQGVFVRTSGLKLLLTTLLIF